MKINHFSAIYDQSFPGISVIRDSNVVQLDVDSDVNHVVGPLNPKPVDHREPVFVGGVPGKSSFKGTHLQIQNTVSSYNCYFSIKNGAMCFHYTPNNSKVFGYNVLS